MTKKQESYGFVDQPLSTTGSSEAEIEKNTKEAKLARKPKVGETIIGDDGIKGRIR